jgi:hypothetical protein
MLEHQHEEQEQPPKMVEHRGSERTCVRWILEEGGTGKHPSLINPSENDEDL